MFFLLYNAFNFSTENAGIKKDFAHSHKNVAPIKTEATNNKLPKTATSIIVPHFASHNKSNLQKNEVATQSTNKKEQETINEVANNTNKTNAPIVNNNTESNEVAMVPEEINITTIIGENRVIEYTAPTKSTESSTLADIAKDKLNKFLKKNVGFNKKQRADGTLAAYQFSAGDFEFSKTVKSK